MIVVAALNGHCRQAVISSNLFNLTPYGPDRDGLTLAKVAAIAPTDYPTACGFAPRGRKTSDNDGGLVQQFQSKIFNHVHRMSGRASMLGKTLRNFASQLLGLLISIGDRFLLTAVLLRMWPTDLFADWMTLTAWSGLLGLADLGFVIFVGNRLQKAFGLGDEVGFQRQVGTAAFIYALLGLLIVAIAALLAVTEAASPFVSVHSLNSSEASLALFSLGVMQAVQTTKSAFTQIYRGRGEFSRGVIIDSVSTLCIVVTALATALGGAGPRVLAFHPLLRAVLRSFGRPHLMASRESFRTTTYANTLKHRLFLSCRKVAVTSPKTYKPVIYESYCVSAHPDVQRFRSSRLGPLASWLAATKRPSDR